MPEVSKAYRTKYGKDLASDITDKYGKPLGPLMAHFTRKQGKSDQVSGVFVPSTQNKYGQC